MKEVFRSLLEDYFAHLGELALYESKNKAYMVQVLKQEPDKLYEIGEGQFVEETLVLKVSAFDVLQPMVGDIFVIGDCKYKVHTPPLRDKSGMICRIEASGV